MYKVGIISEVHGTVPLVIPFTWKIPPLFLIPSYLLGIPPLRVVRFPSTLVPGCLCTDFPPPFFLPVPFFPFPNGSPFYTYMPSYEDITTSASHSPDTGSMFCICEHQGVLFETLRTLLFQLQPKIDSFAQQLHIRLFVSASQGVLVGTLRTFLFRLQPKIDSFVQKLSY
jgi:hypothetical protein